MHPHGTADDPRETREAQLPFASELDEAEQEVDDKPDPHLPLHRSLVVSDEVPDLARLLELLEEELDRPPRLVELGDRPRRPVEVVREEHHLLPLALDDDLCRHAPEQAVVRGVLRGGRPALRADGLVLEDLDLVPLVRLGPDDRAPLDDPHLHVPFLPHDEEHAAQGEFAEEAEVGVRAVRDEDVAVGQVGRDLCRADGIVVRRALDYREGRHLRAEVEVHVQLRRGLLAAMPSPVDAVQHELDRAGVEQVDVALPEAGEVALVLHLREVGKRLGEVLEQLPVQLLGEGGVAFAVRVRQGVAVRHGRVAQLPPFRFVDPGRVADSVEGSRSRQLLVDERDDVAPDRKALVAVPHVPVDVVDDLRRDEGDNLPEYRVLRLRTARLRNPGRRSSPPALRMRFLRMTLLRLAEFGTISHEDLLSCLDSNAIQLYTNGDPLFAAAPWLPVVAAGWIRRPQQNSNMGW